MSRHRALDQVCDHDVQIILHMKSSITCKNSWTYCDSVGLQVELKTHVLIRKLKDYEAITLRTFYAGSASTPRAFGLEATSRDTAIQKQASRRQQQHSLCKERRPALVLDTIVVTTHTRQAHNSSRILIILTLPSMQ